MHTNFEDIQKALDYRFSDESLILEALTHKSYHFENPNESIAYNERLEFLGDSVLGLVVADFLFRTAGGASEAEMSKIKSQTVMGKVLTDEANRLGLGRHLKLGRGEDDSGGREKASILANAMEALLGAVFVDGGYTSAKKLVMNLLRPRLEEAILSGKFADYKSELQEVSQMRFGVLPEYRLLAQEGAEHEKTFTMEACINDECFGTGRGKTKKEAQANAAREALTRLRAKK